MKIKCFPILMVICISLIANGQNYLLKGRVTDLKNKSPIAGAAIFIFHNHFTYSNGNGEYVIT
ncbi:MAG: carboxypeptidase-like regulatory domain-containing protein, partial [Ignavibacteriaceae bacterium]|nr:carboxypeptidase-like regulatory domain-containing protein [Ignavibacteriaceae bacterium]